MPRVVILRGIPGSGKSTYIAKNLPDAIVASADHYFMRKGHYEFNKFLLGKAHNSCHDTFSSAIEGGAELVVVDNTNVKARDMRQYVEEAIEAGYTVEIVRLECSPATAAKRGLHGVPLAAVERMAESLAASKLPEDFPAETVVPTDES